MKFWTKSLYMVGKILLAKKKKNITKIFEKKTFFIIITEKRRWRNFSITFSESTKKIGGNNPLILAPSDSVTVAT